MPQPGPPGQANTALWRRWLLPAAMVGFLLLLTLPRGAAPGTALSYTRFLADVGAGTVSRPHRKSRPHPQRSAGPGCLTAGITRLPIEPRISTNRISR
jgi:hypothetical protein